MSALSLRLPNSLHEHARELAEREGISINQLIATALAEKMAALMTEEQLEARARRGNRARYLRVLAQVPDVEPESFDRLDFGVASYRLPAIPRSQGVRPSSRKRTRRGRS